MQYLRSSVIKVRRRARARRTGFAAGQWHHHWPIAKQALGSKPGRDSEKPGGADEIRTRDLRRAKAALSQLSYGPMRVASAGPGGCGGRPADEPEWSWWAILDSNQRPQSYQDCALTC